MAYAAANNLSTDDFGWLYRSSKSAETKGAWMKVWGGGEGRMARVRARRAERRACRLLADVVLELLA